MPSDPVSGAPAPRGGATIAFDKTVHDYGEVGPRSRSVCEFRFKNTGTAVLHVEPTIGSTCGCTVPSLAKTEYAPGEEGVIKVTYSAGSLPTKTTKYLTVRSNDEHHPQVRLAVTSKVVARVEYEPKELDLRITDNSVTCPSITLRSVDGTAFSVTRLLCSGNCFTAEIDPSVQATEFTIQPVPDVAKLKKVSAGNLMLALTHPECRDVRIRYKVRSGFQFVPALPMFFNAQPNVPIQKVIHLSNDRGEDFDIASFSSERDLVKVLEKVKTAATGETGARYRLTVSITPPRRKTGTERIFTDTLSVHLANGQTLTLDLRGFYAMTPAEIPQLGN